MHLSFSQQPLACKSCKKSAYFIMTKVASLHRFSNQRDALYNHPTSITDSVFSCSMFSTQLFHQIIKFVTDQKLQIHSERGKPDRLRNMYDSLHYFSGVRPCPYPFRPCERGFRSNERSHQSSQATLSTLFQRDTQQVFRYRSILESFRLSIPIKRSQYNAKPLACSHSFFKKNVMVLSKSKAFFRDPGTDFLRYR